MELLESRFVSPAGGVPSPAAAAGPGFSPAASTPTQMMASPPAGYFNHRHGSGNAEHHHQQQQQQYYQQHSSTSRGTGTPVRSNRHQQAPPPHATMTIGFPTSASNGAHSITSPLGTGSAGAGGGLSNHSFTFDQPRSESSRDALMAASVGTASTGAGTGTGTGTGTTGVSASVREVTMAAERHMAKIGQRLNIPLPPSSASNGGGAVPLPQQHDCSSASVPASVDGNEMEEDCSSNQTMVTGHHAADNGGTKGQRTQQQKVRTGWREQAREDCCYFQSQLVQPAWSISSNYSQSHDFISLRPMFHNFINEITAETAAAPIIW